MSERRRIADDPGIIDELHKILARENRTSSLVHEHDFGYANGRYECKHCRKSKDELGISAFTGPMVVDRGLSLADYYDGLRKALTEIRKLSPPPPVVLPLAINYDIMVDPEDDPLDQRCGAVQRDPPAIAPSPMTIADQTVAHDPSKCAQCAEILVARHEREAQWLATCYQIRPRFVGPDTDVLELAQMRCVSHRNGLPCPVCDPPARTVSIEKLPHDPERCPRCGTRGVHLCPYDPRNLRSAIRLSPPRFVRRYGGRGDEG